MPLPYITKLCTAKAKSTGLPCQNPARFPCKTCRVHGGRAASTIRRGVDHPRFKHGRETLDMRAARKETLKDLKTLAKAVKLLAEYDRAIEQKKAHV